MKGFLKIERKKNYIVLSHHNALSLIFKEVFHFITPPLSHVSVVCLGYSTLNTHFESV